LMLAIALSVSLPLGIGTGIYLAELADHCQPLVRLAMAILHSTDTFTLNFPVRLRGVATHYCSRKQRLHPAHHWTRRRYPAKL